MMIALYIQVTTLEKIEKSLIVVLEYPCLKLPHIVETVKITKECLGNILHNI